MSLRTLYQLRCDFCGHAGPVEDSEAKAIGKAAGMAGNAIRRIYRSFFGNEVFACLECIEGNEAAKEWLRKAE